MNNIDKYIYMYHNNIVSSNQDTIIILRHILYTFISEYIKLENKQIHGMPNTLIHK